MSNVYDVVTVVTAVTAAAASAACCFGLYYNWRRRVMEREHVKKELLRLRSAYSEHTDAMETVFAVLQDCLMFGPDSQQTRLGMLGVVNNEQVNDLFLDLCEALANKPGLGARQLLHRLQSRCAGHKYVHCSDRKKVPGVKRGTKKK